MGMRVLFWRRTPVKSVRQHEKLEKLLARVTISRQHVPKTGDTANLLNAEAFAKMKQGVYIINCGRGGTVDEEALYEALASGKVAGAAMDVFADEKVNPGNAKLFSLKDKNGFNLVIGSPHVGASTFEGQGRVGAEVAEILIDFYKKNFSHGQDRSFSRNPIQSPQDRRPGAGWSASLRPDGPDLQQKYYELHPYNITRLIKGKELGDDDAAHNVYTRAGEYYHTWLDAGYLLPETQPALYVYRQTFSLPNGQQRTRNAFLTAFELTEFEEGIVLPHERTLSGPKVDRLNLLRATAMNFELIFMLYPDPERRIDTLFDGAIGGRAADVDVHELFEQDVRQQMWVITEPEVVTAVVKEMAGKTGLIIADGHHRYETALNDRNEMRKKHPRASAKAAYNYAMVSMVSMDDPGLVILPTHRLIHSYTAKTPGRILADAAEYFEVTPVLNREALEAELAQATAEDRRIGLRRGYHPLRLRARIMDRLVPDQRRVAAARREHCTAGHRAC